MKQKAYKDLEKWQKVINDATEQIRRDAVKTIFCEEGEMIKEAHITINLEVGAVATVTYTKESIVESTSMKECCANCKYKARLTQFFYLKSGGCDHFEKNGFVCLAFNEPEDREAIWMMGDVDEQTSRCEMFTPNKEREQNEGFRQGKNEDKGFTADRPLLIVSRAD